MKRSHVFSDENTSSETSLRMLHAAQGGQQDAWALLVQRYSRRVYRWCRCAGLQPDDANNVGQEVFRAVARKLPEFQRQHGSGSFRGWVRAIAQNKIRDHFRDAVRRSDAATGGTDAHLRLHNVAEADGYEMEGGSRFRSIHAGTLERIRAEFSDRDWRFFWRLVVDGQTAVEVAAEYGVTANTVRLVKMRILRRLREALNVVDPDGSPT